MKALKDAMPDLMGCEFDDAPARKLADITVKSENYTHNRRWPGREKNVHFWVELENGKAVGWNENPARGWSFPVITLK